MPVLYVANTSKQHQVFTYRHPDAPATMRQQEIRVGAQVRIGGEMSHEVIDFIVKQQIVYGLKHASELSRNKGFVGLCYSVDKPVALNQDSVLSDTFERNDRVLNDKAEKQREVAAAAVAESIAGAMAAQGVDVPRAEVEIVEETKGTPKLARGYEVDNTHPTHNTTPGKKRGKGR